MTQNPTVIDGHDVSKLPGWARKHISDLRRENDRLRERLAEQDAPHVDSDTVIYQHASIDRHPLPNGSRVGFVFNDPFSNADAVITAQIDRDSHGVPNGVEVRWGGIGGLAVLPTGSNSIVVQPRSFR
jgi:hypothetical protein